MSFFRIWTFVPAPPSSSPPPPKKAKLTLSLTPVVVVDVVQREDEHHEEHVEQVVDDERQHQLVEDGGQALLEQRADGERVDEQAHQAQHEQPDAVDVVRGVVRAAHGERDERRGGEEGDSGAENLRSVCLADGHHKYCTVDIILR